MGLTMEASSFWNKNKQTIQDTYSRVIKGKLIIF